MNVVTMLQQTSAQKSQYENPINQLGDSNYNPSSASSLQIHMQLANPSSEPVCETVSNGAFKKIDNEPVKPSNIPRISSSGIPRLSLLPRQLTVPSNLPDKLVNYNKNSVHLRNGVTYPLSCEGSKLSPKISSNSSLAPDENISQSPQGHLTKSSPAYSESCDGSRYVGAPFNRSRAVTRSNNRSDRATSEFSQRPLDAESDSSSVFSNSGPSKVITSKIGSMKNVKHKPGGGNVVIHNEKLEIGPIESKCNSLANVKHKPGGGNVKIYDHKLNFSSKTQSKIQSFQNVKHTPGGGDKQIFTQKVDFEKDVQPKVGSLKNTTYQPGGGDVQIFNERLPWLKYNKPNLSVAEKERIKKHSFNHNDMNTSTTSGSTGH